MRRNLTPTEKRLWDALRLLNREGANFRRQLVLDDWAFDFGDLTARVVVELDGGVHERLQKVAARDERKTAWAAANRFALLRFSNDQIRGDLDSVIGALCAACGVGDDALPLPLAGRGLGVGGRKRRALRARSDLPEPAAGPRVPTPPTPLPPPRKEEGECEPS